VIRPLRQEDARELLAVRLANREFMAPFDPIRPESYYTLEAQAEIARNEHTLVFAVIDEEAIAGLITLSNVSGGAFQSANVGYWIDQSRNGRGLASRAAAEIIEHAFGPLGLHRLEAGTLVDNHASQRVLQKNGFELIGLAQN
jgi:[ribosomal protein S5]-alanine N-acetyltransferase